MWFSVVYSFIDNDTRHHSGQNVVDSLIVIDKSTYHEKPHFDLFFTTRSTSKKMFFSEHELKKALRDTLTRAAW